MDDPSVLASLAAIAAAAACFATPASYLHARTIAQRLPLRAVHSGVPTVLFVQRWECRALTLLFDVTAFSVSVPFYALALPPLAWVRRTGAERSFRLAAPLAARCAACVSAVR